MIALAFAAGVVGLLLVMLGFAWVMDYLMRNGSE